VAITERDLEQPDPLRMSNEIAEVAKRVRRYRRRLRKGPDPGDDDPFFAGRIVAGRSAFEAVRTLPSGDPLRRPLERWIYRLAEERIDLPSVLAVSNERYRVERAVAEPERGRLPLSAMLHRALGEAPRRQAWFASFVTASEPLGDAVGVLWERRAEVASRMGIGRPDAIESPGADVAGAAERWLARTADAFRDVCASSDAFLEVALGAAASEGWPRYAATRTIADLFRGTDLFRSLEPDPGEFPQAHGPASFLRALARVGAAWEDATAPGDQPFVVAHDPYGLRRRTRGALFGLLPLGGSFARRSLGVDPSRIERHRRTLSGAVLVESRAAALRALLYGDALLGRRAFRQAFEGRVMEAFALAVPPHAAGALWAPHRDGHQRFAGLLLAANDARRLRDVHDEDWYRNPRAVEELRDEARRSPDPATTDDALERGADSLYDELVAALA